MPNCTPASHSQAKGTLVGTLSRPMTQFVLPLPLSCPSQEQDQLRNAAEEQQELGAQGDDGEGGDVTFEVAAASTHLWCSAGAASRLVSPGCDTLVYRRADLVSSVTWLCRRREEGGTAAEGVAGVGNAVTD